MSDLPVETLEIGHEQAEASIIWLHGLGADGHDFEPIVPELRAGPAVRFIFPHAPHQPVTVNNGFVMRAWYDIVHPDLRGDPDEAGIRSSGELLTGLIDQERKRGVPPERIVLAGFSQGGVIVQQAGLRYPEPLAGIMVLSSYLPLGDRVAAERSEASLRTPIFYGHGTQDPVVSCQFAREGVDRLRSLGYDVEWHDYPIPHTISAPEIGDIARWLHTVLPEHF